MKYRFIDSITSDVMFEAYGKDLKELFTNAAEAMFSVICRDVESLQERSVELQAESVDDLMIAWLQELIAMVDVEEMFFSGFEIEKIDENHLKAKVFGEPISSEKGETVVKAVTYHKFKLETTKKGLKATISLDV